jgi:hypothetical protein
MRPRWAQFVLCANVFELFTDLERHWSSCAILCGLCAAHACACVSETVHSAPRAGGDIWAMVRVSLVGWTFATTIALQPGVPVEASVTRINEYVSC